MTKHKVGDIEDNFKRTKRAVNKSLKRKSNEIDIEAGLVNPFSPSLTEILTGERKFEELSEEDYIRHVEKVNKGKKSYYIDCPEGVYD